MDEFENNEDAFEEMIPDDILNDDEDYSEEDFESMMMAQDDSEPNIDEDIPDNEESEEIENNISYKEELKETENISEPETPVAKRGTKSKLQNFITMFTKPKKPSKEEQWKELAMYDDMTKLKNKREYSIAIKKRDAKTNVVYMDLNNLKQTNDTKGHEFGDKLIMTVATAIKQVYGDDGYRIGGDEFVVLTEDTEETIREKNHEIEDELSQKTDQSKEEMQYSVSIGYSLANEHEDIRERIELAETRMYNQKKSYKEEQKKKEGLKKIPAKKKEYNQLLNKDQQRLKVQIIQNHEPTTEEGTSQILAIIHRKIHDIEAILISSKTFDHLFIITNPRTFLDLVDKMDMEIDFSYLYVLYRGGPQYYGIDEYTSEITHLFEEIGNNLLDRSIQSLEDVKRIKGINIFKEIYTDF